METVEINHFVVISQGWNQFHVSFGGASHFLIIKQTSVVRLVFRVSISICLAALAGSDEKITTLL